MILLNKINYQHEEQERKFGKVLNFRNNFSNLAKQNSFNQINSTFQSCDGEVNIPLEFINETHRIYINENSKLSNGNENIKSNRSDQKNPHSINNINNFQKITQNRKLNYDGSFRTPLRELPQYENYCMQHKSANAVLNNIQLTNQQMQMEPLSKLKNKQQNLQQNGKFTKLKELISQNLPDNIKEFQSFFQDNQNINQNISDDSLELNKLNECISNISKQLEEQQKRIIQIKQNKSSQKIQKQDNIEYSQQKIQTIFKQFQEIKQSLQENSINLALLEQNQFVHSLTYHNNNNLIVKNNIIQLQESGIKPFLNDRAQNIQQFKQQNQEIKISDLMKFQQSSGLCLKKFNKKQETLADDRKKEVIPPVFNNELDNNFSEYSNSYYSKCREIVNNIIENPLNWNEQIDFYKKSKQQKEIDNTQDNQYSLNIQNQQQQIQQLLEKYNLKNFQRKAENDNTKTERIIINDQLVTQRQNFYQTNINNLSQASLNSIRKLDSQNILKEVDEIIQMHKNNKRQLQQQNEYLQFLSSYK